MNQILNDEDLKKVSGGEKVVYVGSTTPPPPGTPPGTVVWNPWGFNLR
jgi:hypothetical protein